MTSRPTYKGSQRGVLFVLAQLVPRSGSALPTISSAALGSPRVGWLPISRTEQRHGSGGSQPRDGRLRAPLAGRHHHCHTGCLQSQ